MKTLKFKNGDEMPALGLGTWLSKPKEVYHAVRAAIQTGYRHIDCAAIYGNESEVGEAIQSCIKEGVVTRDELWITSKLWNNAHAEKDVLPALKKTLVDLQLDYLNLYLIHWPVAIQSHLMRPQVAADFISLEDLPLSVTWKGMEQAVELGLVKHIGVSNCGPENLKSVLDAAKIKPAMNQVERHPYLQQKELKAFCEAHEIHMTGYSPLGSPNRPAAIKGAQEPSLLKNPSILAIAHQHDASAAQVLIAWALQTGAAVIPKSVNPQRIQQNFEASKLQLSHSEMAAISSLEMGFRYVNGSFWVVDNGPYEAKDVWK